MRDDQTGKRAQAGVPKARPESGPPPRKSLGQHFLRRPEICRRIADLVRPAAGDSILEIGPGPGALTLVLESLPHEKLLLLEKDRYWAEFHAARAFPGTETRCLDALDFPWEELQGAWKIAGNLPYNVASPLIWDIASRCRALVLAVFMVQKEVGLRLTAVPGTGDYGALSVWVQAHLTPRLVFPVGPSAFSPPPKVDSAVLDMLPRPLEERPGNPAGLARLLRICFQNRRKQLGGLFRRRGETALLERLEAMGIPLTARPEELSPAQFLTLSEKA